MKNILPQDLRLLTNFKIHEEETIKIQLKAAGIEDYTILPAYDTSNNLLPNYKGIYVDKHWFKDNEYKIELFFNLGISIKQIIFEEYRNSGIFILPENVSYLYVRMPKDYIQKICTEVLNNE